MTETTNPSVFPAPAYGAAMAAAGCATGALRGDVWLTVQSQYASNLIRGRPGSLDKPPIPGLLAFADRLRVIWAAACADDPYADWWLIKIDDELQVARTRLLMEQAALEVCFQRLALQINIATSRRPERVALQFTNPYAYWGAHLVAVFDRVACSTMTARHVGLLSSEKARRQLHGSSAAMRRLFSVPQGFRLLHIDRKKLGADVKSARRALDSMGTLPQAVLDGTHRAPLAPSAANGNEMPHVQFGDVRAERQS